MKHEGMARAMSELDDDLIASACQYRAKPHKTYLFPRMLAAAACLVLIATAALVVHRTSETDIYIDGTALSADPVPIDQPMPMALDGRSTDVQTLCLSLSFESRTDAPLEVSVSEGILDSTADVINNFAQCNSHWYFDQSCISYITGQCKCFRSGTFWCTDSFEPVCTICYDHRNIGISFYVIQYSWSCP